MSIPEIKVTVQGIGPLTAMMAIAPEQVTQEMTKAMQKSVLTIEGEAKRLVPVKTGNLRRSLHSEVKPIFGGVTGIVGTPVDYAPDVELGTGIYGPKKQPILIQAKNAKALKIPTPDGIIFRRSARVPGMKPRPYLRPAFDSKLRDVEGYFRQALQNVVRRLASRA